MHSFQTIPLLLVSPSLHVHLILFTGGSLPVAVSISILAFPPSLHFFPYLSLPRLPHATVSVRLFRKSGSFTFSVDSMRKKNPVSFVRIVWRDSILNRTCSKFFALSAEAIVPREHFPRPLYTIIGREKQCARPGKRIASTLAIRPANYVKHHVRALHARLPRRNRVASFIAIQLVTRDKSSSSQKELHPAASRNRFAIAFSLYAIVSREVAKNYAHCIARLTVAISNLSRSGSNCTLLHFSTCYCCCGRLLLTDAHWDTFRKRE